MNTKNFLNLFVLAALLVSILPTAAAVASPEPEDESWVSAGVAAAAWTQVPAGSTEGTGLAPQTILTVDTAEDLDNGSCSVGNCSLRDAIAVAGAGDTIVFAGDYSIYLNSTLTISKELTVDGSGRAITVSGDTGNDGSPNVRVFTVSAVAVVTLTHLSIVSGTADFGGGIYNAGTLVMADCTLSGNSAAYENSYGFGGGIYNEGALAVAASTLSDNSANSDGGGICNIGTLIIASSTLSNNSGGDGGGIRNAGTLTLTNGTLFDNSALRGGGIYNTGTLAVTGSSFSGNSGDYEGGGIFNNGGILTLTASTLSSNGTTYRGGGIYNTGTLTVTGSTLSGNLAGRRGGSIFNEGGLLMVASSILSGNSAGYDGGGIFTEGTLTVTGSILSGNSAGSDHGLGGGIYNGRTLTVTGSTLSDNSITHYGGAIYNAGTLAVTGSTFSGNSAGYNGGGIYNNWGTLTVTGSTLSGNSSAENGGGIYNRSSSTLNYANTIIANSSSGGDCVNDGTIGLNSYNLVQDGSCSAAFSGDPLLDSLDDNGGDALTHALLLGSPAIDAIPPVDCTIRTDQRGASRNDWACDIGAFEVQFGDSDTVSKTIVSGNTYTFGPTLLQVQVSGDGGCLTGLTIRRIESNHSSATDGIKTGRYWDVTPIPAGCSSGLSLTVTLPLSATLTGGDKACRYTGAGWDCGQDADNTGSAAGPDAMPNIVARQNVTRLSEWAVGANVGPTTVRLARFSGRPSNLAARWLLGLGVLAGVALVRPRQRQTGLYSRRRSVRGSDKG